MKRILLGLPIMLMSVTYAQNTDQRQPVPGTLTPAQQQEIDQALPPLQPPPTVKKKVEKTKPKKKAKKPETNIEWAIRTIKEINKAANKLYEKNKTYVGAVTYSALEKEVGTKEPGSLDAPWGASFQIMSVRSDSFTVRISRVPAVLCKSLADASGASAIPGVRYLNGCSSVLSTPLMYIYTRTDALAAADAASDEESSDESASDAKSSDKAATDEAATEPSGKQ